MSDILKIIKKRTSIRKYKDKAVPVRLINKIIEAGIWGPSVHHLQAWNFKIIEGGGLKKKFLDIVSGKLEKISIPGFIFFPTKHALASAQIIVCIYNTNKITNFVRKINMPYVKNAMLVELSAISAAIQNMILMAESLKIGSCWLDTPLLCEREINGLFNTKDKLIAVLTLGYPAEKGNRSRRIESSKMVCYLK